MAEKIVLGLSGGVDSAVAAARLRAQGFEVHGLFLEVGLGGEDAAQHTADDLGIPLYIAHRREAFEQQVCAYFADSFRSARTPNPCVVCNPLIKFRALTDYADEIGAPYIATGHYARTGRDAAGRALLLRARAPKDQTYMMHRLPRKTVARCVFPLGESARQGRGARKRARDRPCPVADKPDSMDICFIPDGDVHGWLERHGAACPPGNFVDEQGNVLGRHQGHPLLHGRSAQGAGRGRGGPPVRARAAPGDQRGRALARGCVPQRDPSAKRALHRARICGKRRVFLRGARAGFRGAATARPSTPMGTAPASWFEDAVRAPAKGSPLCCMTAIS